MIQTDLKSLLLITAFVAFCMYYYFSQKAKINKATKKEKLQNKLYALNTKLKI